MKFSETSEEVIMFYNEFLNLSISNIIIEKEGKAYEACQFTINNKLIISRKAKITPKKIGQFVTCWKRNANGETEPFHEKDAIEFYCIKIFKEQQQGLFVFPKSILIQKKILATNLQEGKRGFRVYPKWDTPASKQAIKTQQWQSKYFHLINEENDLSDLF